MVATDLTINIPPSRSPIAGDLLVTPPFALYFQQIYNKLTGDVILTSPNGNKFKIVVSNTGILSTTPL